MLTIVHDVFEIKGSYVHTASCGLIQALGSGNVTCEVARALIASGHSPSAPVRIVQADPVLSGPPYQVDGLTLQLASTVDPFCATGPEASLSEFA